MKFLILLISLFLSVTAFARDKNPEHIFKMKFCETPDLFNVEWFDPSIALENHCIYSLDGTGYFFRVAQSVNGGIIVNAPNAAMVNRQMFIKTNRQYADGDVIYPMFVKYIGITRFTTVQGAPTNIHSFQFLADGHHEDEEANN